METKRRARELSSLRVSLQEGIEDGVQERGLERREGWELGVHLYFLPCGFLHYTLHKHS